MVLTSFQSFTKDDWCFDSGSSSHMTGEKNYITYLKFEGFGQVCFSDGVTQNIVGKGKLKYPGFPPLEDVLLVDGLSTNLISISQLCDQGLNVSLSKDKYIVSDDAKAHHDRYAIF